MAWRGRARCGAVRHGQVWFGPHPLRYEGPVQASHVKWKALIPATGQESHYGSRSRSLEIDKVPRPPKSPTGRTFVTRCKYEWVAVGSDKLHDCGVHGVHAEHLCSDDGCDVRTLVATGGGRYRGSQKRDEAA